jgi:hypothetical protein
LGRTDRRYPFSEKLTSKRSEAAQGKEQEHSNPEWTSVHEDCEHRTTQPCAAAVA